MLLTFNIEKNAKPIINATQSIGIKLSPKKDKNLKQNIDNLILICEGFINHIPELNKTETKTILDKIKYTTNIFIDIDEKLNEINYLNDIEMKDKFQYLLKALSKIKSFLHISYTMDAPVNKTPHDLKFALSNISRESISKKY